MDEKIRELMAVVINDWLSSADAVIFVAAQKQI